VQQCNWAINRGQG